jgi:hypothetical protein
MRNNEAALPNDYVVCDVDEVIDACAFTYRSLPVSALIYAGIRTDVHVTVNKYAFVMGSVLARPVVHRGVSEARLSNATVWSHDTMGFNDYVWPNVNTGED